MAVDAAGNVVIADGGNHRVRVVAARTGSFYGIAMTAGDIYTIAGNGTHGFGFLGGIQAPGATLRHPLLHLTGPAAVRLDRLEADVRQHLNQQ